MLFYGKSILLHPPGILTLLKLNFNRMKKHVKRLKRYSVLYIFILLLANSSYAQSSHTPGTPWPGLKGYYVKYYPDGAVKEEGLSKKNAEDKRYEDAYFDYNCKQYHITDHHLCYWQNGSKKFEYWRLCPFDKKVRKKFLFINYSKTLHLSDNLDTGIFYSHTGKIIAKGYYDPFDSIKYDYWQYYDTISGKLIKEEYIQQYFVANGTIRKTFPSLIKEYYPNGMVSRYESFPELMAKAFYPNGSLKTLVYNESIKTGKGLDDQLLRVDFDTLGQIVKIVVPNMRNLTDLSYSKEIPFDKEYIKSLTTLKEVMKRKMLDINNDVDEKQYGYMLPH